MNESGRAEVLQREGVLLEAKERFVDALVDALVAEYPKMGSVCEGIRAYLVEVPDVFSDPDLLVRFFKSGVAMDMMGDWSLDDSDEEAFFDGDVLEERASIDNALSDAIENIPEESSQEQETARADFMLMRYAMLRDVIYSGAEDAFDSLAKDWMQNIRLEEREKFALVAKLAGVEKEGREEDRIFLRRAQVAIQREEAVRDIVKRMFSFEACQALER